MSRFVLIKKFDICVSPVAVGMKQSPERKKYLAEFNEITTYTAKIIHGEEVSKVRINQYKKYFRRTFNMLNRIAVQQAVITNKSFRYGYGGKPLIRKIMLDFGVIEEKRQFLNKPTYKLLINHHEITLELVSRIIVEVYLIRNKIEPL